MDTLIIRDYSLNLFCDRHSNTARFIRAICEDRSFCGLAISYHICPDCSARRASRSSNEVLHYFVSCFCTLLSGDDGMSTCLYSFSFSGRHAGTDIVPSHSLWSGATTITTTEEMHTHHSVMFFHYQFYRAGAFLSSQRRAPLVKFHFFERKNIRKSKCRARLDVR